MISGKIRDLIREVQVWEVGRGEDLCLHKARVDCGREEELGSWGGGGRGSVSHILLCLQK